MNEWSVMDYIKFVRREHKYIIESYNNDDFYVLGKLLINPDTRAVAKKLISEESRFPSEWPLDQKTVEYLPLKAQSGTFELLKHASHIIDIQFSDTENKRTLEITINDKMLTKVIKQWESYESAHSEYITVYTESDSDDILMSDQQIA